MLTDDDFVDADSTLSFETVVLTRGAVPPLVLVATETDSYGAASVITVEFDDYGGKWIRTYSLEELYEESGVKS